MAPSSSRNGARVIWVAVHTAEGIRKASDLKAYFDRIGSSSSSHAVADDATLIDNCVPYDRAAWTLRDGNPVSDNLELCGFAAWSREEWLTHHQGMLNNAARWIHARCTTRGIPVRKLSPVQVGGRMAGVIGHVDYTNGTGDGTHWDPGPGFPWDVVMARASNQEEDMQLTDKIKTFAGTEITVAQAFAGILARVADKYPSKEFPSVKAELMEFVPAMDQNIIRQGRDIEQLETRMANVESKLDQILTALHPNE